MKKTKSGVGSKARQRAHPKAVTPPPLPWPKYQLLRLDIKVAKAFMALNRAIAESYGVTP